MIIGITGLPCSGTDSFASFLAEKNFIHFNYSDMLREELKRRNTEITRKSLQDLGNEIRKKHGAGELSKRLLAKMDDKKNYVVGTIRNPGEVHELRKRNDFVLVRIEASPEKRFEWMKARNRENDPKTWEEFLKLQDMELGKNQEPSGLQIKESMVLAEKTIVNDSTLEDLKKKAEEILKELE